MFFFEMKQEKNFFHYKSFGILKFKEKCIFVVDIFIIMWEFLFGLIIIQLINCSLNSI